MQRLCVALLLATATAFVPFEHHSKPTKLGAALGTDDVFAAANACLEDECSVDTIDLLLAQLRSQESTLKKGRIARRPRPPPPPRPRARPTDRPRVRTAGNRRSTTSARRRSRASRR